MAQDQTTVAQLLEAAHSLNLEALCRACHAEQTQLLVLVQEGVLQPQGETPAQWRFDGLALSRTRRALRLQRELELDAAAVALVLQLLDRIETLETKLQVLHQAR